MSSSAPWDPYARASGLGQTPSVSGWPRAPELPTCIDKTVMRIAPPSETRSEASAVAKSDFDSTPPSVAADTIR